MTLAQELHFGRAARAPEFNQFTVEMCRAAGFTPTVYRGTVESIRAAADLVAQRRCLYCVPSSCIAAADDSGHVRAVVSCAQAMSKRLGWLTPPARWHISQRVRSRTRCRCDRSE